MSSPLLPRVSRVRLTGYAPLFREPIEFSVPDSPGPYVILGANTLGKTTIAQSIVFALAGTASADVQDVREDKRFQWDLSYFRNRVDDPKNAEVQVDFCLGKKSVAIRRGLDSERVRGVRISNADWVNSSEAPALFESTILEAGNYESIRDFRYIVHRLLYLPENRRNIVWSPDAQLTVFLLVCGEASAEKGFRQRSAEVKRCYNEMRHTHNSMTNVEKQLKKAENLVATDPGSTAEATRDEKVIGQAFEALNSELQKVTTKIAELYSNIDSRGRELRAFGTRIEKEESELSRLEERFVLGTLQSIERQSQALALHKLLVLKRCPYCTQQTMELALSAKDRVDHGLCPICGLEHTSRTPSANLGKRKDAITSEIARRNDLGKVIDADQESLSELRRQEAALRAQINELEVKLPRVRSAGPLAITQDPAALRKVLTAYQVEYQRWAERYATLKAEIEADYADLVRRRSRRYRLIERAVAQYATSFLGMPCTFSRVEAKDVNKDVRFNFPVLVPNFENRTRTDLNDCAESEAFFLDIAFRMALTHAVKQFSGEAGTFICETPESALDVAYTDNVAKMFVQFHRAGCYTLLTANVQAGGVAEPVLQKYRLKKERDRRIFNLIAHAKLSRVQKSSKKLSKRLGEILRG